MLVSRVHSPKSRRLTETAWWMVQEYEERSARIRKLREDVGNENNMLETLTAALEAKKVMPPS